jgi:hypothetical protein
MSNCGRLRAARGGSGGGPTPAAGARTSCGSARPLRRLHRSGRSIGRDHTFLGERADGDASGVGIGLQTLLFGCCEADRHVCHGPSVRGGIVLRETCCRCVTGNPLTIPPLDEGRCQTNATTVRQTCDRNRALGVRFHVAPALSDAAVDCRVQRRHPTAREPQRGSGDPVPSSYSQSPRRPRAAT